MVAEQAPWKHTLAKSITRFMSSKIAELNSVLNIDVMTKNFCANAAFARLWGLHIPHFIEQLVK